MDRFAKKCVIASSIMHGSLVLLLIVGPAFLPSQETIEAKQIIDFIPFKTLETSMSGGGNPKVEQTLPSPVPPQTPRRDEPAPAPTPPRREEPVKRDEPQPREPARAEPRPAPKAEDTGWKPSEKIKPNLTLTTRGSTERTTTSTPDASRSNGRSQSIASAIDRISSGASSPVQIQEFRGPGGGGIPYAGFNDALISAYMRAWQISSELAKLNAKVVVSVTIRRDGTVVSSRIQKRSGNTELDDSVQNALDRVTKVGPFPDSVKDAQKVFWLEFDPQLKPMIG
jgi:TonB family protein